MGPPWRRLVAFADRRRLARGSGTGPAGRGVGAVALGCAPIDDGAVNSNPLLTPGITDSGRDPALHRLWLTVVHHVARKMGGQVLGEAG